ncbi:hypothetical protein E2C01_016407 [Portunus trituberculatus]|uniref:Uncharacterized protein n=1 Tax=Portunus trituberculatus TaxID=210409 RepID=A0A5B7DQN8_PORTR|nr:hypothetical protein [Portunus trituberculatus]
MDSNPAFYLLPCVSFSLSSPRANPCIGTRHKVHTLTKDICVNPKPAQPPPGHTTATTTEA